MAKASNNAIPKPSRPLMPGSGLAESKKGLMPWTWAGQRPRKRHHPWTTT